MAAAQTAVDISGDVVDQAATHLDIAAEDMDTSAVALEIAAVDATPYPADVPDAGAAETVPYDSGAWEAAADDVSSDA
jgi:hypothetical protein